jgi:hypothetical protein
VLYQLIQSFTCDFIVAKVNLSQIGEAGAVEKQCLESFICDFIVFKVNFLQIGEAVAVEVEKQCLESFSCDLIVVKPNLLQIGEAVAVEKQCLLILLLLFDCCSGQCVADWEILENLSINNLLLDQLNSNSTH